MRPVASIVLDPKKRWLHNLLSCEERLSEYKQVTKQVELSFSFQANIPFHPNQPFRIPYERHIMSNVTTMQLRSNMFNNYCDVWPYITLFDLIINSSIFATVVVFSSGYREEYHLVRLATWFSWKDKYLPKRARGFVPLL